MLSMPISTLMTRITIKDNGIGIEPQFHKTIFQLFRRCMLTTNTREPA